MTDVIVHHLLTDNKVRIRCRNWVKKIAIYKNRLAVLLPTRITIYELYDEKSTKLHYRIKERIKNIFDCDLLVVCSHHIILCQGTSLQCYTQSGSIVRQWIMDSAVRYIKVVGGPPNNEGLIVGLADGQVLKIYIDNPFPIDVMRSTSSILCLDLSLSRRKLALVNDDNRCIVYDLFSKQTVIQEMKGTSVCWNLLFDDMLCYSGNDILNIKISNCPLYQQKFSGYIIEAYGSKVFSLNGSLITTVEMSTSACMYQCLEKQLIGEAYAIACLGVTESDWNALAHVAAENFNLAVAAKAFAKLRNIPYLDIINEYKEKQHEKMKDVFVGDILAYEGRFKEAGNLYQKSGNEHKALEMYTELRMFDLAQEFIKRESSADKQSLIRKKAEWAHNINEPRAAAEMYISAGDIKEAVDIAVDNNWVDMLLELSKKLNEDDIEHQKKIADCLSDMGEMENAVEIFRKIGLEENILQMYIDMKNWTAAFPIVEKYPEFKQTLYLSYATWLIENDKFVEAQKAFHKADKPEQAVFVLKQLIENAIDETRFIDAGYYNWILSRQCLDMAQETNEEIEKAKSDFVYHDKCASIYYAYHAIHKYLEEPFTSYQPEALFNISRFLLNETRHSRPKAVTQFSILYSLAKQARNLGAFKLAKQSLDYIQNLRIPSKFQDFVDVATLMIRAKPYHDNEDLLIMCYRCSTYNPLTISAKTTSGNCCTNCRQPFVYSFVTFEVLPLIEFQLEDDIPDAEAMNLLQSAAPEHDDKDSRTHLMRDDVQSILLDDKPATDAFTLTLMNFELDSEKFNPIVVNRETLRAMEPSSVLVCQWPTPLKYKYYKNLVPELQVTACSSCFKIFHIDDFEMEILQKACCPFCRVAPVPRTELLTLQSNNEIQAEEEYP